MCFFFNDTATTEIYTLSLHDALPIYEGEDLDRAADAAHPVRRPGAELRGLARLEHEVLVAEHEPEAPRSEEHTSELQSRQYLVCRLLLEKKKTKYHNNSDHNHTIYSL